MLLFVRNPYFAAIKAGEKRYELRAGARYRNLRVGDQLSINGRFRVTITRIQRFETAEDASRASRQAGYFVSVAAIRACYPNVSSMVMFHFYPPVGYPDRNERSANHARHVAA